MWNYRVVRKKYVNPDTERASYTYAIHEAYYDNNRHVGAVTQDPVEPFGENIEELRHSWIMMAEAFGLPILDFEAIPEPGYERKEDQVASILDKRIKEQETGEAKGIPFEQVKKDLEEKFGPFDEEKYEKQVEAEREEKEKIHAEAFVATTPLEKLIREICTDYLEYLKRDRTESPWKYQKNAEQDAAPDAEEY
ncbi:MAG: hypothetical protein NTX75_00435 [Proteobacteria bacterium]|nr:hypothetical protein [Pseudomonadota bacterium]